MNTSYPISSPGVENIAYIPLRNTNKYVLARLKCALYKSCPTQDSLNPSDKPMPSAKIEIYFDNIPKKGFYTVHKKILAEYNCHTRLRIIRNL